MACDYKGLSLGHPSLNTSLSGQFTVFSKLVICAMMIRGRHRKLPYGLDRTILMPFERVTAALEQSSSSNKIGSKLYLSPTDLTWADVQSTVRHLEADLARWKEDLHEGLRMENIGVGDIDPRSNLDLEMNLCSMRMILYRPFMCEIRIETESPESSCHEWWNEATALVV